MLRLVREREGHPVDARWTRARRVTWQRSGVPGREMACSSTGSLHRRVELVAEPCRNGANSSRSPREVDLGWKEHDRGSSGSLTCLQRPRNPRRRGSKGSTVSTLEAWSFGRRCPVELGTVRSAQREMLGCTVGPALRSRRDGLGRLCTLGKELLCPARIDGLAVGVPRTIIARPFHRCPDRWLHDCRRCRNPHLLSSDERRATIRIMWNSADRHLGDTGQTAS